MYYIDGKGMVWNVRLLPKYLFLKIGDREDLIIEVNE